MANAEGTFSSGNGPALHGKGMVNVRMTYRAMALIVCALLALVAGGVGTTPPAADAATPGPVLAWGNNRQGQLGATGAGAQRAAPGKVAGAANVLAIAAGEDHNLALKADGTVLAWGSNDYGQLGIGSEDDQAAAVPVGGLAGIVALAAGSRHSLALKGDGTVWAWGYNDYGELGQGSVVGPETCPFYPPGTNQCSTSPVQVPGLTNVVQVATGMDADHVLALKGDGTVWSWGYNANGELGHGTVTANPPVCQCEPTPAQVIGPGGTGFLTGVALPDAAHPYYERIGIAYDSSYAVMADGTVYAWGHNDYGQLGLGNLNGQPDATGTSCTCWTYPVHVVGSDGTGTLGDIVSLGSGGDNTGYAITSATTLYAWGYNYYGQLGNGTEQQSGACYCNTVPGLVLSPNGPGPFTGVLAVSASDDDWVFAVVQGAQFTVTVSQDGTGTVTPGTSTYFSGTEASFTATPGAGQVFLGWTLDGQYVGFASPLKFTVNGDRTLKAMFAAAPSFSDVPSSDADYQAITFLAAMGIINPNGVNGSGQFQPDRDVVRAEMASFVARVFGWQKEFHVNYFPDKCDQNGINCVDDELWNNVAALADYGVVGGYTDQATCASAGTTTPCYLPRDPVLRVQVISIIARAFIKDTQRPNSFWDRMAADLGQYTNVPNSGTQRSDLTTFRANAGPIPGQADDTTFPDPTGNGSRRFVVEALYEALASWYGTDRVP